MTYLIMNDEQIMEKYTPHIVFANTGCEHEKTLEFIHKCETNYGWNVHWLEAVVREGKGNGTRHKVVDFHSASRNGEPFLDVVKKYGIPNVSFPFCSRELKLHTVKSWIKEHFGKVKSVPCCIGIRTDEDRRATGNKEMQVIYPLIDWFPSDKQDVKDFWQDQPFNLGIPPHLGNCVFCYKKTDKKLIKSLQEAPKYWEIVKEVEKYTNIRDVKMFRGHRTMDDFVKLSQHIGEVPLQMIDDAGCSESCEFIPSE